jgi:hypothetical protein
MSLVIELLRSIVRLPGEFAGVATHDPLSALLMLVGAVLVGLPSLVFGYLVVGAVADLFTGDGAEPRRPAR